MKRKTIHLFIPFLFFFFFFMNRFQFISDINYVLLALKKMKPEPDFQPRVIKLDSDNFLSHLLD